MRTGHSLKTPALAAVLGAAALLGTVAAPTAHAQVMITANRTMGPGGDESPVSASAVRRYADVLGLDDDQRDLMMALFEGYTAAVADAGAEFQEAMLSARQAFEDTGDSSVFMEVMPAARDKRSETMKSLERQFFDDVGLILSPEQAVRVPRMERMRRRDVMLPGGSLSGESVDLTEIIDSIGADPSSISETMTQYEVELDRVLVSRTKIFEEGREAMNFGRGGSFDIGPEQIEKMEEFAAKSREASLGVKAVNDRYARIIASQLDEAHRADFERTFHEKSFPQVYRRSSVQEALAAAEEFGDLTDDQRRAIQDLAAAHARAVDSANKRWASAIEESEQNDEGGAMAFGPGMFMRIGEDQSDSPVGEASKNRREIDQRTREKLLAALTEDQRERLPKRRERQQGAWVAGSGGLIEHNMVIEIDEVGGGG